MVAFSSSLKSESEVAQLCPTLWDPMDCSLPGSSVHGIFQARVLEWVTIAFSILPSISCQKRNSEVWWRSLLPGHPNLPTQRLRESESESEVTQACPTLCHPLDCSLPGSSVHGIFQAILLGWIAISFSSGSSWPGDWTRVSCIVDRHYTTQTGHPGSPTVNTWGLPILYL